MQGSTHVKGLAVAKVSAEVAGRTALALLLCAYTAFALRFAPSESLGDESGYLSFAHNILQGYYSPPGDVDLWWGPGYPLLLAAVIGLHLPVGVARVLNALFMTVSVGLVFFILRRHVSREISVLGAAYAAVAVPVLENVRLISTEPLTLFLLSGWAYAFCRLHDMKFHARWTMAAAAALAYLALTKVLFGYALAVGLVVATVLAVSRRGVYRRWLAMYALSLAFCLPYLTYTFGVTGKPFYWGNSGGLSLYWMASPYAGEVGDWQAPTDIQRMAVFAPQHNEFFTSIAGMPAVAQDDAIKGQAVHWILDYPSKYIQNWAANVGRMVMNYPYSYKPFKPATSLSLLAFNLPAIAITLLGLQSLLTRRTRGPEFVGVAIFLAIALTGSSLLSAYPRQFSVLLPLMLVLGAGRLGSGARNTPPVHKLLVSMVVKYAQSGRA
jgi:hypothetical protein